MELGVFTYILDAQGRVLLVRDVSREQRWGMPGGGLDSSELVTDCAVRECREEASIDIAPGRILGIFSQQKTHGVIVLVEGRITGGTLAPDGKETAECGLFSWEEILAMRDRMKPAHLSMIHQVRSATADAFPLVNVFVPPPA